MKIKKWVDIIEAGRILWLAFFIIVISTLDINALAQGTAFNYNGRLQDVGNPATGVYDLRFRLCNAITNGDEVGSLTNMSTGVTNGLFTAALDFGVVFKGSNYWLELAARTNGAVVFTVLNPRQPIMPVPYAIYAASAGSATTADIANSANSVAAANITGPILLPQLPLILVTNGGVFTGKVNVTGGNVVTNLSDVYLFTNSTAFFNGQWHNYASSTTCGLQEVLDSLNDCNSLNLKEPHGGKINFGMGVYRMTSPVYIITTNISLVFEGAGVSASGILYDGTVQQTAIRLETGVGAYVNLSMSHMFLAGNLDTTNYLLYAQIFGKIDIRDCWFGYWPAMQGGGPNHADGLQPPHYAGGSYAANLSGICLEGASIDNVAIIQDCDFLGLKVGFVNGSDHSVVSDNMFLFCGANNSGSGWFTQVGGAFDLYTIQGMLNFIGGSIVVGHSFHQNQRYYNNYFYGGYAAYLCDDGLTATKVVTIGDGFESMQNNVIISSQSKIVQINPHGEIPSSKSLNSVYPSSGVYTVTGVSPAGLMTERLNSANAAFSGYSSINFGDATLAGNGGGLINLNPVSLASGNVGALLFFTNPSNNFSGTFSGVHVGDGSALTNISANSIRGGATVKLAVTVPGGATNTLCFTNGILMTIQ